jgi:hypothetical protein
MVVICGNKKDIEKERYLNYIYFFYLHIRKVSFSEAEEFAKKKNCLYFEVSAKTDVNIKKMLYHSLIELPFFDKYKNNNIGNIDDLIGELENNNNTCLNLNDSDFNNSGMLESSRNNNNIFNINSDREQESNKKEKCKC